MIKALIRMAVGIGVVLLLARLYPPFAEYQQLALVAVVAAGLFGLVARSLIVLLVVAGVLFYFYF